jgi:hypothetical protein
MWTIRTIIRCFKTNTKECTEFVIEECICLALQELFGTVFVGVVAVTYPSYKNTCTQVLPAIICVIMHCPDKYNEIVPDAPESTALLVEQSISLALHKRLDDILVDIVTVSHEDRWCADSIEV